MDVSRHCQNQGAGLQHTKVPLTNPVQEGTVSVLVTGTFEYRVILFRRRMAVVAWTLVDEIESANQDD